MNLVAHEKVTPSHLKRNAYLYVRQSTLRQVFENTESTKRQYALRQRAIALGWATEQIVVIDCDLGQSGASAVDRAGFQQLVAEVGLGQAGIVLGLEVSRLARSSTDWHRLGISHKILCGLRGAAAVPAHQAGARSDLGGETCGLCEPMGHLANRAGCLKEPGRFPVQRVLDTIRVLRSDRTLAPTPHDETGAKYRPLRRSASPTSNEKSSRGGYPQVGAESRDG
jgi:Resolvase, N terminal domain